MRGGSASSLGKELPDGWRWAALGETLDCLETGARPAGGAAGISEGVPSISGEHMNRHGGFDFADMKFVPHEFYGRMKRGHIRPKDVLVVKDGATTGKTSFVDDGFPYENAVVNEHVFICRGKSEVIDPKFLFFWLWGEQGQADIRATYQGAAIGGINQGFADKVMVPLPPLAEQKRIAAILTEQLAAVEQAREASEARLEAARALPAAYLREVFGSADGDLPQGWRWAALGDVSRVVGGTTPQTSNPDYWGGDIVWVTPADLGRLSGREISTCERRITQTGYDSCALHIVPPGSVILSTRAPIGHLGIAQVDLCTNQGCRALVPAPEVDSTFLYFALRLSVDALRSLGSGSTFTEISKAHLEAFEIPLPPLEEQKRIAAVLTDQLVAVERIHGAASEEAAAIAALPAALLRQAFSGDL